MALYDIDNLESIRALVGIAQNADEPIIVVEGEDECLVAMRPAVFERILLDGMALNTQQRSAMHF